MSTSIYKCFHFCLISRNHHSLMLRQMLRCLKVLFCSMLAPVHRKTATYYVIKMTYYQMGAVIQAFRALEVKVFSFSIGRQHWITSQVWMSTKMAQHYKHLVSKLENICLLIKSQRYKPVHKQCEDRS